MREFFHGWRRKIGVVSLVMACVLMAGWIRSFNYVDLISFSHKTALYDITSGWGAVTILTSDDGFELSDGVIPGDHWRVVPTNAIPPRPDRTRSSDVGLSFLETCGFHFESDSNFGTLEFGVPYWSIAIPLTLLAAWLLLSKPRVAKLNQTIEPASPNGPRPCVSSSNPGDERSAW